MPPLVVLVGGKDEETIVAFLFLSLSVLCG
jgi:hypothetical protein